jgi:hypothetical protein
MKSLLSPSFIPCGTKNVVGVESNIEYDAVLAASF